MEGSAYTFMFTSHAKVISWDFWQKDNTFPPYNLLQGRLKPVKHSMSTYILGNRGHTSTPSATEELMQLNFKKKNANGSMPSVQKDTLHIDGCTETQSTTDDEVN